MQKIKVMDHEKTLLSIFAVNIMLGLIGIAVSGYIVHWCVTDNLIFSVIFSTFNFFSIFTNMLLCVYAIEWSKEN